MLQSRPHRIRGTARLHISNQKIRTPFYSKRSRRQLGGRNRTNLNWKRRKGERHPQSKTEIILLSKNPNISECVSQKILDTLSETPEKDSFESIEIKNLGEEPLSFYEGIQAVFTLIEYWVVTIYLGTKKFLTMPGDV